MQRNRTDGEKHGVPEARVFQFQDTLLRKEVALQSAMQRKRAYNAPILDGQIEIAPTRAIIATRLTTLSPRQSAAKLGEALCFLRCRTLIEACVVAAETTSANGMNKAILRAGQLY